MIIHEPERQHIDGSVRVRTVIEAQSSAYDLPGILYFSVPEAYEPLLTDLTDPFLTALLTVPMLLNEPVEVRGTLSSRLYYGLQKVQGAYNFWFPDKFHIIDIHAPHLVQPTRDEMVAQGMMGLCSGGIDSLYSLWTHLPTNMPQPDFQLTHAVFLHGLDIPLHLKDKFERLYNQYRNLLAPHGVDLIPVETNITPWMDMHLPILGMYGFRYGGTFAGMGQLFGRGIAHHLVSASFDYSWTYPWATHPGIDYYFGTETLSVYHDGTDKSRMQKLERITEWQDALRHLRVCLQPPRVVGDQANCCQCYKCTATMLRLELLGALKNVETFPDPLTRKNIYLMVLRRAYHDPAFFSDTIPRAIARGAHTRLLDLYIARVLYRLRQIQLQLTTGKSHN